MTDFLPLSSLLDVIVVYLVEGIKGFYRMIYAIAKLNKVHIKTIQDKAYFMSSLGQHSRSVIAGSH